MLEKKKKEDNIFRGDYGSPLRIIVKYLSE